MAATPVYVTHTYCCVQGLIPRNYGQLLHNYVTFTLRPSRNIVLPCLKTSFSRNLAFSSCISRFNALPPYFKHQQESVKLMKQLNPFLMNEEY